MPPGPSPSPVIWLSVDQVSADFSLLPGTAPEGRLPLAHARVLILVGLTGAGKTATVAGLAGRGAVRAVLPDRRDITDRIILPAMTGDPSRTVTDRLERFRLTAAFRERHPGGMGDVLERLAIDADTGAGQIGGGWMVFDGVRGPAEAAAAARLPNAVFAVLLAPPELRVARLCLRDDPFDRAAREAGGEADRIGSDDAADPDYVHVLEERGVGDLLTRSAVQRLARVLSDASVDLGTVGSSSSIVVEESRYYDSAEALAVLNTLAPGRTVVADTSNNGIDAVVDIIATAINRPLGGAG